jgi:hypothetical protein
MGCVMGYEYSPLTAIVVGSSYGAVESSPQPRIVPPRIVCVCKFWVYRAVRRR